MPLSATVPSMEKLVQQKKAKYTADAVDAARFISGGKIRVGCTVAESGLRLTVFGRAYALEYPGDDWKKLPDGLKEFLADNIAFLTTAHLPVMLPISRIEYETAHPLFKSFFYQCLLENVPFSADMDKKPVAQYMRRFMNAEYAFGDYDIKMPRQKKPELEDKAVVTFSFGKDSLATYAVLKELGIGCILANFEEADVPLEVAHKRRLSSSFEKEFDPIHRVKNEFSLIHDWRHFAVPKTEWGYGHLITEYCLESVPFAIENKARYIAFGNEKSCSESYHGAEGFRCYPVFDQTHRWMVQLSTISRMLTGASVVSVIEPLNDLALMKLLHQRYPGIAKYQMSCFPDENQRYSTKSRWCGHCSKCARIFIFMKALGISPEKLGFQHDMLQKEFSGYFSIFNAMADNAVMGWDRSQASKEEQLFAFYLAIRQGAKGQLMDAFRAQFYSDVQEREDELYKKFFGIHSSITMPPELKEKVLSIYREALNE